MSNAPLLLEIGCEEIPARMIPRAADELGRIVVRVLDHADLAHGSVTTWGGSRRLTVRVEAVEGRQADREETLLGPPAKIAFDEAGAPTKAAVGFARKQGVDPSTLQRIETGKGVYAGFRHEVEGKTLEQVLGSSLPAPVVAMSFPKTMRWADGSQRWVRPVHWILALHGGAVLKFDLLGVRSGGESVGHRFRSGGAVPVPAIDAYESTLQAAGVIVEPARRREILVRQFDERAGELGGRIVEDTGLLAEVIDLVEWPGVVGGRFDEAYLELPRELLVTTLRHHQKCFSVQDGDGNLMAAFLAVANTDQDPGGHVRRGNEWVVGGRLDDARFFWAEDRTRGLSSRFEELGNVVFHAKVGSFADKAGRMADLAGALARRLKLDDAVAEASAEAARLCKIDLVTGTVGEFPELQGKVGGLMLAAEGRSATLSDAVYAHYQPLGPGDDIPATDAACVVSVADKLDSVTQLVGAGETPTGSRDPFALRRASSGILRIVIEKSWPLSLRDLAGLAGAGEACFDFLIDRLRNFLLDGGATANEIRAVMRPRVDDAEVLDRPLPDVAARLAAVATVRRRADFALLADLTKRVDNILVKGEADFAAARASVGEPSDFDETKPAALRLWEMIPEGSRRIDEQAAARDYAGVIEILAEFVSPVEQFFADVLVLDPKDPKATLHRRGLLDQLSGVLTRCFDIRELAGQAERRDDRA